MGADRRAADFGAALSALWAAHDLADHVIQTDHQAANKATNWRAMTGHVGSYTAVQLFTLQLLRGAGVRPSWRRLLAGVAFSAGTHALLDHRWPVRWLLEHTGSPGFAAPVVRTRGAVVEALMRGNPSTVEGAGPLPLHGPYLADQALHHAVLAVCAAILAGGRRG